MGNVSSRLSRRFLPLDVGVEAGLLVEKLPIDGRRSPGAGRRRKRFADMDRPDRHAATLPPTIVEVGNDAGASPSMPLMTRDNGIICDEDRPALVKLRQFAVRGEYIRRK